MSQFEVVEVVFESENPVSKQELISKIDLHPDSIRADIKNCIKKGHIIEVGNRYDTPDEFDEGKLESIRPKDISEITDGGADCHTFE